MLRLDLTTIPGGVKVNWRSGKGLTFHRRDGSLIIKLTAEYADDRALMTAAHALNFMFGNVKDGLNTETKRNSGSDRPADLGDGGQA